MTSKTHRLRNHHHHDHHQQPQQGQQTFVYKAIVATATKSLLRPASKNQNIEGVTEYGAHFVTFENVNFPYLQSFEVLVFYDDLYAQYAQQSLLKFRAELNICSCSAVLCLVVRRPFLFCCGMHSMENKRGGSMK